MKLILHSNDSFAFGFYRLTALNTLFHVVEPLCAAFNLALLGHLDVVDALVGVSATAPLFRGLYGVATFLRIGTTGVVAQAVGRNDLEETTLVVLRNSLIALGIGALTLLLLKFPLEQLWMTRAFSDAPNLKAAALHYFQARVWGTPAVLVNLVLIGWLLGCQKSGMALLLSLVGNFSAIALNYLLIVCYHWDSAGAGLAQALSQGLILLVGLMCMFKVLSWPQIHSSAKKLVDIAALKALFTLNGNTFIRSLCNNVSYILFFAASASLGPKTLAENALLMQVATLGIHLFEGIGFTTETLAGNLEGQGARDKLLLVLKTALSTGWLVGLSFTGVCVLFSRAVFGLLTHYGDILDLVQNHVLWLWLFSAVISTYTILDAYFAGLAQSHILRNASLAGVFLGFLPAAWVAYHFHSNHLLWLAMSFSLIVKSVTLGWYLLKAAMPTAFSQSPILE